MMEAGRLRHQVRIELRTSLQDGAGEPQPTWQFFAEVRAEIMRTPGSEIFAEGRDGRVPTVFRVRFLDGVKPQMRLLCRGKLYDIVSAIDPDGHRAELMLSTLELVEESP